MVKFLSLNVVLLTCGEYWVHKVFRGNSSRLAEFSDKE